MKRRAVIGFLALIVLSQIAWANRSRTAPDMALSSEGSGNSLSSRAVLKVCPANMPAGCAHTIDVEGRIFRFEGATVELQQNLKNLIEAEQSPTFTRELPVKVEGFFVQKSGMWPDTTAIMDVLEVTSLQKTLPKRIARRR